MDKTKAQKHLERAIETRAYVYSKIVKFLYSSEYDSIRNSDMINDAIKEAWSDLYEIKVRIAKYERLLK